MGMLLQSLKNEILLLKNYQSIIASPYLSIQDILDSCVKNKRAILNNNLFVVNDTVINKDTISSPVTTVGIINKINDGYTVYDSINLENVMKRRFSLSDKKVAIDYCQKLLVASDKLLVTTKSHKLLVKNISEFEDMWEKIKKSTKYFFIEKASKGDLFKFYIKDDYLLAVYLVAPAHVIGNGKDSIEKLILDLKTLRESNIRYRTSNVKCELNKLDYIPKDGEFIQLNNSLDIEQGAVYVDMTHLLQDEFKGFPSAFKKSLLKINYLEVSCYSENILSGINDKSFIISDIKQNNADLKDLFSCCKDRYSIEDIVVKLFKEDERIPLMKNFNRDKSSVFCNPFLKNASQSNILKEAANRLGLKFTRVKPSLNRISDVVTGKSVLFQSGMSQYTSFLARSVSNDKFLTKMILENISINTPMGFKVGIKEKNVALARIDFSDNKKWVLKPLSGSGGSGVTTDIRDLDAFETAWNICVNQKAKTILIEEQVSGNDYRVVVIQDYISAVTQRIAAYVIGDGKQTIRNLIKIKAEERKKNPFYRLKVFEPNEIMVEFLLKKGLTLDSVPDHMEKIELLEAVNIGSGGESIDKTDVVHPAWNDIAVKIRKAILNAHHIGLDLMAEDISKSPDEQSWSVIEVNTNPDLGLQLFPEIGQPRDIGKSLLLSIFGDMSHLKKQTYILKICGKVQKVGFREWFKSICTVRSINGYIYNTLDENVVEALIQGYESTLDEVIELAYEGPKYSEVEDVIFRVFSESIGNEVVYESFTIR